MTKTAYVGLIIIALLVGLYAGYCMCIPIWGVPQILKYDIFKDILTIVLTVLAVGITVIGYGIYIILSERLKAESASTARLETLKGSIHMFIHSGFVFWQSYDSSGKKEKSHLEMAIGLTERALLFFNEFPDDQAKSRENDSSLCYIKNNLSYYYAERKKPEDRDLAQKYIEYLCERMSKYPEERKDWLDTHEFVKKQYPN